MKPRLNRTRLITPAGWDKPGWRCSGGGVVVGAFTPGYAYVRWEKEFNRPWRRALRWLKDLRKEREV